MASAGWAGSSFFNPAFFWLALFSSTIDDTVELGLPGALVAASIIRNNTVNIDIDPDWHQVHTNDILWKYFLILRWIWTCFLFVTMYYQIFIILITGACCSAGLLFQRVLMLGHFFRTYLVQTGCKNEISHRTSANYGRHDVNVVSHDRQHQDVSQKHS